MPRAANPGRRHKNRKAFIGLWATVLMVLRITRRQRQRLVGAWVLLVATQRFLAHCECDIEALAACTWRRGGLRV